VDLELSDDQRELSDNIRHVLEGACSPSVVRGVYEGTGNADELWSQMTDLYWPALGIAEEHGGLGMTFVEVALLAEELGRATAPGPLLATVTQFAPVVRATGGARSATLLEEIAAGTTTGALAWPEHDRWELDTIATTATPDGDDWILEGTKTPVLSGGDVDLVAVIARAPGTTGREGLGVFVVKQAELDLRPRSVLDPTLPLADIVLAGTRVDAEGVLAEPGTEVIPESLERAAQEATVAMALTAVGACRRIFELTLDYAKVRVQYDRIIGSFQALKHRLADMYLAVERANAICYYAALTIAEDDERRAEATHLAKAAAGDCQRLLAEDGLQLHGGIGYTWEHDLHFLLKRAKAADVLCGGAGFHRAQLATMLGLDREVAS
jgi:alkylation response protein AidB-like acyl-CoA dehydrogenase